MDAGKQQRLRDEMRPFVVRNSTLAYGSVILDFIVFIGATVIAVAAGPIWLKLLSSVTAGTMISTLFVLGHDATHGSLVSGSLQNKLLGRLLFLPALHNYTLWRTQHNRLHHLSPNLRGLNSWSPYSPADFLSLPFWRRVLERMYRGGGFGLYYLVERWWKHKFIPGREVERKLRRAAWQDFALLMVWVAVLVAGVVAIGDAYGQSWFSATTWGIAVPYLVWNWSMGLTVFLQHTHFSIPWFRSEGEAHRYGGQEELTIHVKYPRWYGLLSHDIMEHPAHHINPLIPFYHLHAAQTRLNAILGDEVIVEPMSVGYALSLMRRCKLYDYDRQEWTDFSGRTTGQTLAGFVAPPA
jgi:omega-6 fatty acid desaturase (delta-12 desaturase)